MRRLVSLVVLCAAAAAAADPAAPLAPIAPPPSGCKPPAPDAAIRLTFQPETSIRDLATWITTIACKRVVVDPAVLQADLGATVLSPSKLTPKQALQLILDAIEATGVAVVQKPDAILIKPGPGTEQPCTRVTGAAPSASGASPAADPDDRSLADAIAAGVTQIDETHYEISASLVDMVLANPKILGKFRTVPSTRNGKQEGAKIFAIRPSSLLATLGFANGDTVLLINKRSIDPPNDLHELHTMFRVTKLVVIDLERRGKPVMMMFKVTP